VNRQVKGKREEKERNNEKIAEVGVRRAWDDGGDGNESLFPD